MHLLVLASAVTRCISVSAFASSVGLFVGIAGSAVTKKICVMIAGMEKYKLIIKKKKKKYDKTILLSKS